MRQNENFVFNLRVEIKIDPDDKKIIDKFCKEEKAGKNPELPKEGFYAATLDKLKGKEPSLFFNLDLNPDNFLFHDKEEIFRQELVDASIAFVKYYTNFVVSKVDNMVIAKQTKVKDKATSQKLLRSGLKPVQIDPEDILHVDSRRINKIVYRKNSPVLANVSLTGSANGDVQPPGSKRP